MEALNGVHDFIAEKVREMPQSTQKTEPVSILQPQTTVNPDRVKQVRLNDPKQLRPYLKLCVCVCVCVCASSASGEGVCEDERGREVFAFGRINCVFLWSSCDFLSE